MAGYRASLMPDQPGIRATPQQQDALFSLVARVQGAVERFDALRSRDATTPLTERERLAIQAIAASAELAETLAGLLPSPPPRPYRPRGRSRTGR